MSERLGDRGRRLVDRRERKRGEELEVYEKRGRSRRFELTVDGESLSQSVEAGWAARGGDADGSFFVSAAGEAPEELPPVTTGAPPIRLPPALPAASGAPPRGLDAPLATESEGRGLLAGLARELARERPDLAPPRLRLEEGASEWAIVSSRGVAARGRARSAVLRVELVRDARRIEAELIARSASDFKPTAVARRLVDRVAALAGDRPPEGTSRLLLAPPVAARLVEALSPWWIESELFRRLTESCSSERVVASEKVTLVDDGGRVDGLLASAVDGEGVPTRRTTLVERGRLGQPLLAWWECADPRRAAGCSRRDGWRDLPTKGATQLHLEPDPATTVGALLSEVGDGAYLIAAEGGVSVERAERRFSLPVSGFALVGGRAAGGLGPCRLAGSLDEFLRGVRAVGRDLSFVPGVGLFGSPTLAVDGLELVAD